MHSRSFRKLPSEEQDDILELLLCQAISVRLRDASGDQARCEADVVGRFGPQAKPADVLGAMDACLKQKRAAAGDSCTTASVEDQRRALTTASERTLSGALAGPSARPAEVKPPPPAVALQSAPVAVEEEEEEEDQTLRELQRGARPRQAAAAPLVNPAPAALPRLALSELTLSTDAIPAALRSTASAAAVAFANGARAGVSAVRERGPEALAAPAAAVGLAAAAFAVRSVSRAGTAAPPVDSAAGQEAASSSGADGKAQPQRPAGESTLPPAAGAVTPPPPRIAGLTSELVQRRGAGNPPPAAAAGPGVLWTRGARAGDSSAGSSAGSTSGSGAPTAPAAKDQVLWVRKGPAEPAVVSPNATPAAAAAPSSPNASGGGGSALGGRRAISIPAGAPQGPPAVQLEDNAEEIRSRWSHQVAQRRLEQAGGGGGGTGGGATAVGRPADGDDDAVDEGGSSRLR